MRVRKKLLFLHTCFSLVLAATLAFALRPAISNIVNEVEANERSVILSLLLSERDRIPDEPLSDAVQRVARRFGPNVQIRSASLASFGLIQPTAPSGQLPPATVETPGAPPTLVALISPPDQAVSISVVLDSARASVRRVYVLLTIALLAIYALVAAALEFFVLPRHVYQPLQRILDADLATREGRPEREIIPDADMPADELGEIMASRNQSIRSLRQNQSALSSALAQIELVATDLKRKNHLLEAARRNLADADRLASLGMMSAGIAHELNTPLAVVKGLAEKLHVASLAPSWSTQSPGPGLTAPEAALLVRVVARLERLSESLLDFARARPPTSRDTPLRALVDEAWTLVRLDRAAGTVAFVNRVPSELSAYCDADRILQVLVNIIRNAVDAGADAPTSTRIDVIGESHVRDGADWTSLLVLDDGPGIPPELIGQLFQPFVTARLDSKGTGLGLAVADGIVREHGGIILARNRTDPVASSGTALTKGACFEIVLPRGGIAT